MKLQRAVWKWRKEESYASLRIVVGLVVIDVNIIFKLEKSLFRGKQIHTQCVGSGLVASAQAPVQTEGSNF
jgi:hypothetical protein